MRVLCVALAWDVQEIIKANYTVFVDSIETMNSVLVNLLLEQTVITHRELQEIKAEKTNHEQNEKLLSIMTKKSQKTYKVLLHCLDITGQTHIADIMRGNNFYTLMPASGRVQGENTEDNDRHFLQMPSKVILVVTNFCCSNFSDERHNMPMCLSLFIAHSQC